MAAVDEDNEEDWEDDEQRLIKMGGNGIPMGEVRPKFSFSSTTSVCVCLKKCVG